MSDLTVFQRLLAAAREGAGIKLTAQQVLDVVQLQEVRDRAYRDDAEQLEFDHLDPEEDDAGEE